MSMGTSLSSKMAAISDHGEVKQCFTGLKATNGLGTCITCSILLVDTYHSLVGVHHGAFVRVLGRGYRVVRVYPSRR